MRKSLLLVVVALVLFAGFLIRREGDTPTDAATAAVAGGGRAGGRSAARPPMPVEFATARRAALTERVLVVGNLIGAATVVETSLARNKSLLDRQLLPRQTYDDTEARHQAAVAQLDLAKAQPD